jgi:hypothetical protein
MDSHLGNHPKNPSTPYDIYSTFAKARSELDFMSYTKTHNIVSSSQSRTESEGKGKMTSRRARSDPSRRLSAFGEEKDGVPIKSGNHPKNIAFE